MEKFFGLIIVLIIFVVGRVLESIQRKQMEEQKRSRQSKPGPRPYEPPRRQSPSQPSAQKKEGYQAPQADVEDFLRTIGMLPPKEQKPEPAPIPAEPTAHESEPVKPTSQERDKSPQPVDEEKSMPMSSVPYDMPVEAILDEGESLISSSPQLDNIPDGISGYKSVTAMLHEKGSLKKAFILSEILQKPVSLRRSRSII